MNRIPTLDGWRGIAILLVLVTHLQISLLGRLYHGYPWMNLGQHGVGLFFVLSGYLITSLLLREDKIDLPAFYMRRFFRLMPVAWLYLLVLAVAGLVAGQTFVGNDAWACLGFFRNYFPAHETAQNFRTGHFWSLSLEEQFYLLWPPILALAERKWALGIAGAAAIACAVFRFLHWQAYNQVFLAQRSTVRFDALLVGCIFALLLQSQPVRAWFQQHGTWLFWVLLPVLLWHIDRYQMLIPLSESVTMAVMMVSTSLSPASFVGRVLEYRHLKFLGVISYSLYVWQQAVLFIPLPRMGALLLPLVGIMSYGMIERPCIAFGRRAVERFRHAEAGRPPAPCEAAD